MRVASAQALTPPSGTPDLVKMVLQPSESAPGAYYLCDMRCMLELNSPLRGTGWSESWSFSGKDGEAIRDCCMQLEAFAVEDADDRWQAAAVRYWIDFPGQSH